MTSKLLSQAIGLSGTTGNSTNITLSSNGSLQLAANNGTDIFISANDNIGFGNTTPVDKLSIQGSLYTSSNTVTIGTAAYHVSNGNFGLGTSTPGSALHVTGSAIGDGNGGNGVHIGVQAGYATIEMVGTNTSGSLIDFSVANTDYKARILHNNSNNHLFIEYAGGYRVHFGNNGSLTTTANNFGVGATLSSWHPSAYKAIQIGKSASFYGHTGVDATYVGSNMYDDGAWKYISSSANSSLYQQYQGQHTWYQAGSGTAGANISFTQAMTLDVNGNLGIGIVPNTDKFVVKTTTNIDFGVGHDVGVAGALTLQAYNDGRSQNVPMEFRASTFYFTGVASGTSTPFVIETGGGIQSTLGRYTFPDTSGTSQFIYLGRWSLSNQSGTKLYMKIISGSGFNADNAQNQVTEVFFKTSNGSSYRAGSTGNYFADGQVWKFGMNNDAPNYIRVVAVDNVTYDFYGYFGNFTGNYSFYEVSVGSGSWTNSGSLYGTTSPSGNYIDLTQNTSGDACKAWVNFNASSGSAVVRASAGVTSVTRNGVSDYTVNFSIVFRDSSYSIAGSAGLNTTSQKTVTVPLNLAAPGTSSVRIQTPQNDGAMGQDAAYASIVVMR